MLERSRMTYLVVGSFASGAYGEPRFTQDIDLVIELSAEQVDPLCGAFPPDEYYVSGEAARTAAARGGQFNVIHPDSGNKIDFMIARTDPWGREQLRWRRRIQLLAGREGFAAAPEEVILGKMLYFQEGGSVKHPRDIAGILKISGGEVDRAYVDRWASQLGVTEVWEAVLRRVGVS